MEKYSCELERRINVAYQMIHIEVAYELLEKITWIERREDFLLGAIAPGAKKK
ncbi:MAG: hypothetical protein II992_11000 [Lachnospiraceae bacterium]|nr:hypothetical protein [Lachnospiraceae bacterium]MBQ3601711.1 hypothetical protein [Lachnospiraceae bacterium]